MDYRAEKSKGKITAKRMELLSKKDNDFERKKGAFQTREGKMETCGGSFHGLAGDSETARRKDKK